MAAGSVTRRVAGWFVAALLLLHSSLRLPVLADEVDILEGGNVQEFQAEVSRLMDIIISSIYSQKDVFLRELVSNSADALEKFRFLALSQPELADEGGAVSDTLTIRIKADPESQTLTISDTGVGMTKDELTQNLGTVARSGTTNFLEAMAAGKADVNLIGQFGVGFYSAFLVADRVTVASRPAGQEKQYVWQSNGASFAVAEDPRGPTLKRGTEVTLHLKGDALNFLDNYNLRSVISRYNQFVQYPIYLGEIQEVEQEAVDEPAGDSDEEIGEKKAEPSSSDEDKADVPENKSGDHDESEEAEATSSESLVKPKVKKLVWEQVNTQKPLWLRAKDDVTDEEYKEFFKSISHAFNDPLTWVHFSAEGEVDFKALMYIPKTRPFTPGQDDLSAGDAKQKNVRIYARRVLVSDGLYDFLPRWLTFVHGVVDSDDLPLKVDRESLSQSRMLRAVSKKIVGKVMDAMKKLGKDHAQQMLEYHEELEKSAASDGDSSLSPQVPHTQLTELLEEFGKEIKYGCIMDEQWRSKIVKVLLFKTNKTGKDDWTTLDEMLERMPEEQKEIYFIANDNFDAALGSPHVQYFLKKGFEVLILTDPFDEHCLQQFPEFGGRKFVSVEKTASTALLSQDERSRQKQLGVIYKPLTDGLRKALKGRINSVVASSKLVDDAVALGAQKWGSSAYTERLFALQQFGSNKDQVDLTKNRILEINPDHPLIKELLNKVRIDPEFDLAVPARRLMDAALINSGFHLQEPRDVVALVTEALSEKLGVAAGAVVEPYVLTPADEELLSDNKDNSGDMNDNVPEDFDMGSLQEMLARMQAKEGTAAGEDFGDGDDVPPPGGVADDSSYFDDGSLNGRLGKDEL